MRIGWQRAPNPFPAVGAADSFVVGLAPLRRAEWLVLGFFAALLSDAVLLLEFRHVLPLAAAWLGGTAAVLTAVAWVARRYPCAFWNQLRIYVVLAAVLCSYRAMDWFAPASPVLRWEAQWQAWDRALFADFGFGQALEAAGPVLPALLEVAYALVYALPVFCVVVLSIQGRNKQVDSFLTVYLLGLYLSYLQFPFWPSRPPWQLFPQELTPAFDSAFRQFNGWVLGGAGIHTSVFPSAHVSGAVAAALGIWRLCPASTLFRWGIAIYAVLVTLATVYCRYHYAVDALAGVGVAVLAYALAATLWRREKSPHP